MSSTSDAGPDNPIGKKQFLISLKISIFFEPLTLIVATWSTPYIDNPALLFVCPWNVSLFKSIYIFFLTPIVIHFFSEPLFVSGEQLKIKQITCPLTELLKPYSFCFDDVTWTCLIEWRILRHKALFCNRFRYYIF